MATWPFFVILAPLEIVGGQGEPFCARSSGSSTLPAADPALLPCLVWHGLFHPRRDRILGYAALVPAQLHSDAAAVHRAVRPDGGSPVRGYPPRLPPFQ